MYTALFIGTMPRLGVLSFFLPLFYLFIYLFDIGCGFYQLLGNGFALLRPVMWWFRLLYKSLSKLLLS